MILGQTALALIGLLLAAWAIMAAWFVFAARARVKRAENGLKSARRLARMVEESPAIPLLVRADGRIEASPRLARWLGLDTVPQFLTELGQNDGRGDANGRGNGGLKGEANANDGGEDGAGGIPSAQMAELAAAVRRTQKTGAAFRMVVTPAGSRRSLSLRGHLADPQVSPGGAALVWVFDFSESEGELVALRQEATRARADFSALVGLIEAAPMPMWFRDRQGRLRLVNRAYVAAVQGESAQAVVAGGTELVEPVDGLSAAQIALQAADRHLPIERMVAATVGGQRRTLRVSDLPLSDEGIAGYAIDIEDMEELARSFRAFREAQRSMLDQLSAGVAQFDAGRTLIFANQPFQRIFALKPAVLLDPPPFERLLDMARDGGRLPEVRDFPVWRRERAAWFRQSNTVEESWPLSDGTHLRIVAQPMPDGGLMLIAEDQTEQLRLSASRDTLLRTRTATFDSLFESLGVFARISRYPSQGRSSARTDRRPAATPRAGQIGGRRGPRRHA